MARKLGLKQHDKDLNLELLQLMYDAEADFTNTYRCLARVPAATDPNEGPLPAALAAALPAKAVSDEAMREKWRLWVLKWRDALRSQGVTDDAARAEVQNKANPKFVPRNWVLQLAIEDAEKGDYARVQTLFELFKTPYDEHPEADPRYSRPTPKDLDKPGVTCLSCSS